MVWIRPTWKILTTQGIGMMVKSQGRKQFLSRPKMRGMTPAARESAWLQHLATQRNRSGYPLPAIPGRARPQRATRNAGPRPKRAQQRNKIRAGYGPGAMVPYLGPPRSDINSQIGSSRRPNRSIINKKTIGGMSACARLYAVGVVNPFSFFDSSEARSNSVMGMGQPGAHELPCVPNYPTLKTRRQKVFMRGSFNTFADGTALMALSPLRIANNYPTTASNACPLFVSNGVTTAPAFPSMDLGAALPGGFTAFNWNSDYAIASITLPTFTYRVVGCGLRLRYTGTEMNRGGTIHFVEEPNHQSLGSATLAQISAYESYFRVPVTRDWSTLVYTPVLPFELDMQADSQESNGQYSGHYMGCLIACPATSVSFEWEVVGLYELSGPTVRDQVYSETDIRGFEMIQNVMRPETQLVRNQEGPTGVFKMIVDGAQWLTQNVVPAAKAIGGVVSKVLF
jgi:hypothetical protein